VLLRGLSAGWLLLDAGGVGQSGADAAHETKSQATVELKVPVIICHPDDSLVLASKFGDEAASGTHSDSLDQAPADQAGEQISK
jgi:hypothetical protein